MRQKIYIGVCAVFVLLLLQQCSSDRKVHRQLMQMASSLNESTPIRLDEYTTFVGAEVTNDNVFRYNYSVTASDNVDSILTIIENQTKSNIKEAFSLNPDLQIFTKNNLSVDYVYKNEQGKVLKTIQITPKDYK